MTNELDRAIATINRHLLYAKLCAVFIQNGNVKSCLQMMGIDLDSADEEPMTGVNTQLPSQQETPSVPPDTIESLQSQYELSSQSNDNIESSPIGTDTETLPSEDPPLEEKPKKRGRKKKKEVAENQDEFDEAYKKAYSEALKDDKNGQTNG